VVALFAVPFKHRLEWNKLRCQAAVRPTAANKALASSESSQSVRSYLPLTPVLLRPYNILSFWSLSDIAPSTTANDDQASTLFSVPKNPQRIPANTPPAFRNLRPRICLSLLRLVTNGNVGKAPANPLAF
jgi:hypothetical protein